MTASPLPRPPRTSRMELGAARQGPRRLVLEGTLVFEEAGRTWRRLRKRLRRVRRGESVDFDMSAVETIDGGTMALLVHLRGDLVLRGVKAAFVGAPPPVQQVIELYGGDAPPVRPRKRRPEGGLSQIGRETVRFLRGVQGVFGFLGDMILAVLGLLKEPRTANWREVPRLAEVAGADAIPIVVLINFLMGFVMAFQGAVQLEQFGANIFVADLVGLAITRELGPLMTAIIVCGRSGAAYAAELGSMRVSEEIDALRTMGFGPMRYLVLPRMVALILVVPALTLVGDLVGMTGGLVVGLTSLDISAEAYLNETIKAVHAWDVLSGLLKSLFFAAAIALIACQQGFAATGGAEGVGRRTTASVVASLFALILIDTLFTVSFHLVGA